MKKFMMVCMVLLLTFSLVACNSGAPATKEEEATTGEVSTGEATEELVTEGVFKSIEDTDKEGIREALFTDKEGNDFVAIIGVETKVPEEFLEGKTYLVHHGDMQTTSLPAQLPQVYSIELAE